MTILGDLDYDDLTRDVVTNVTDGQRRRVLIESLEKLPNVLSFRRHRGDSFSVGDLITTACDGAVYMLIHLPADQIDNWQKI